MQYRIKFHASAKSQGLNCCFKVAVVHALLSQAEPHTHRENKETHEFIFSWLSWLAVLLVVVYARGQQQ